MKKVILVLVVLFNLSAVAVVPSIVYAETSKEALCQGVGLAGGSTNCDQPANGSTIQSTIKTALNILSFVVGVVAVIMIIIGGLRYVTSGGDSAKISGAKDTILYAIIGLVVVAMSQFIVRFVLTKIA